MNLHKRKEAGFLSLWFSLCLIIFLVSSCAEKDDTRKQRFLIRANDALAQQNYREAIRLYEEALAIDSCYVPARNNLGIVHFEQQHYGQAILAYDEALRCEPENYDAILNRANAFYESGELYRAEDDLGYLIKNHADSAELYYRLALVHARLKDFRAALDDFTRNLSLDPENSDAFVNRGTVYYYLNELENAESDLRKALQYSPDEGYAYNALSMIAIKRGDLEKARQFAESALGFESSDPYFLNNLGYIHLLEGNLEEARELIDLSITRDPLNAWAYRNKGRYYHLKGDYENALRLYERALREDDFVELIHTFRGDALLAADNLSEACEAWRTGVKAGESTASERLDANCRTAPI